MSAAADYWMELEEAEMLAAGARGIRPDELSSRKRGVRWEVQQTDTGATSGPRSSSGSKEGRGQL